MDFNCTFQQTDNALGLKKKKSKTYLADINEIRFFQIHVELDQHA